MADTREPIESGCPDPWQYMHPVMRKNFGQWKYHEHPRPGVLRHVAWSGDEIWTVKAGTQRILDIEPNQLHQRVSVILGSKNEVERAASYFTPL